MALPDPGFARAQTQLYCGRWWLAGCVYLLGGVVLLIVLSPLAIVFVPGIPLWFAVFNAVLGILLMPLAAVAIALVLSGWGEAISRVELGPDGMALALPSWHGIAPVPPVQRIAAAWHEVRSIRRRTLEVRIAFLCTFICSAYRVATDRGDITLMEPLRPDQESKPLYAALVGFDRSGDAATSAIRPSIPVPEIVEEISRRAGVVVGESRGLYLGGYIHALFAKLPAWEDRPADRLAPIVAAMSGAGTAAATVVLPTQTADTARHRTAASRTVIAALSAVWIVYAILHAIKLFTAAP